MALWYLFIDMKTNDLITVDADILGGVPVFKGTRVPVKTLFEYLEDNYSLDNFWNVFPPSLATSPVASFSLPKLPCLNPRSHEDSAG